MKNSIEKIRFGNISGTHPELVVNLNTNGYVSSEVNPTFFRYEKNAKGLITKLVIVNWSHFPLEVFNHTEIEEMLVSKMSSVHFTVICEKLINLKVLNLWECNLHEIPKEITNLKKLEVLGLRKNKIRKIPNELSRLKNLKKIYFNENEINSFPDVLLKLPQLRRVAIFQNKIKTIPAQAFLKFDVDTKEEKGRGYPTLLIGDNPLIDPPIEIIRQGNDALSAYFKSINKNIFRNKKRRLNQLKTLIIGDAHAGKTSLLKKILKKEFDYSEPTTHGVNIHVHIFNIEDEDIQSNFWDFGGQEIMHGTHTFFYSKRSIYILVLDARREGKEDYWLKHIESFGGDSPVLVVLNKIDENPSFDVNRAFLRKKYPNIKGFVRLSCATGEGVGNLVAELEKQIHALEMRKTPFAKSWFEVKEALDQMSDDYIGYDKFYEICRDKEVTDEIAQTTLLQFLHDLGIVLAFRELELHDTQVINPLWLTNAVYRIINSEIVAGKDGKLFLDDLNEILNDKKFADEHFHYPKNKFLYIVKIMREFELCYRLDEKIFMVPDLLSVEEKEVPGFDFDSALKFVLQYDFFPTTILPRFMVQLHTRIVEGQQWRTGVVLDDPIFKSRAVVKADRDEKRLYIWVKGDDREKQRQFFNFIRKTLSDIKNSFEKLPVKELVPLPDSNEFVDYKELEGLERMGFDHYVSGILSRKFKVEDLLNGIEAPERRRPHRNIPVPVFVSYAHKDMEYKEELKSALAYLERMDEIDLWEDGRIKAGTEWEPEIYERLEKADVVICLVSNNFIASDFCFSIELKRAMEAHKKGEKIIIPIQIKRSGWKKLELGKIKGVPVNPISSFSEHDDGWVQVYEAVEGAVKRMREKRGGMGFEF